MTKNNCIQNASYWMAAVICIHLLVSSISFAQEQVSTQFRLGAKGVDGWSGEVTLSANIHEGYNQVTDFHLEYSQYVPRGHGSVWNPPVWEELDLEDVTGVKIVDGVLILELKVGGFFVSHVLMHPLGTGEAELSIPLDTSKYSTAELKIKNHGAEDRIYRLARAALDTNFKPRPNHLVRGYPKDIVRPALCDVNLGGQLSD